MNVGDGAIVLTTGAATAETAGLAHSLMVRVEDVDRHHEHVQKTGARVLRPPTDYPYGERQYTVMDRGGHVWTFSQTIADVNPEDWGGTPE
jgi:uncharacterized glyoxalase superfamily protein PhnB